MSKCNALLRPNAKFALCGTPVNISNLKQNTNKPSQDPIRYLNWSLNIEAEKFVDVFRLEIQRHHNSNGIIIGIGTKAVFFILNGDNNILAKNKYLQV